MDGTREDPIEIDERYLSCCHEYSQVRIPDGDRQISVEDDSQ